MSNLREMSGVPNKGLPDLLLSALEAACLSRELEVADHILAAIEAIGGVDHRLDPSELDKSVAQAYAILAARSRG